MKTIITPIYNGIRARNFFRTDTYRELIKDPNIRLVVVVPPKVEYYQKNIRRRMCFRAADILGETAGAQSEYLRHKSSKHQHDPT